MEKLISGRCNLEFVPKSYILPQESRPGKADDPPCNILPVIDFGGDLNSNRGNLTQQIIKASQEFGFFQLVNHGIPKKLLDDALQVAKEFWDMPIEYIASLYSEDRQQKSVRVYTSVDYDSEDVHYWRDCLRHHCHPLQEHIQNWPDKPTHYRNVIGTYSAEMRKLGMQLVDLICEGLGLESGYFNGELSSIQMMSVNHFPPCPDPSLTLGLASHSDLGLITILLQDETGGLQVFKDGKWFGVEPIPNALVVNLGHMSQIISNGKLKSADHRVVTNNRVARTTVASFIHPSQSCHIEPAKALIDDCNPPLYKGFEFKDFSRTYIAASHARMPALERYKL